ncbi:MAG TPA: amidohydrolase [Bryobacteraceae bacterium]|nr:amidohydrolase [Bryobacteraceae bacterium]
MMRSWGGKVGIIAALAVVAAQAQTADQIWTAGYVVTMDAQRRVIADGAVAVSGKKIIAVGPRADIVSRFPGAARLDRPQAILMPGLINTHTHAAMTLLRGIADDRTLQDWLEHYIFPAEKKNVTPEFVLDGTRLACLEMLLSGATTFTDMYYFEDRVAQAAKEAGMRAVVGDTIISFPSPDAKSPADALAWTENFIRQYRGDPLIVPAVAVHSPYLDSPETLKQARALADKYGAPLLIHVSETQRENEDSMKAHGMSSAQWLDSLGVLGPRTVAAHGVWLSDEDIGIFRRRGVGVAHCPASNMKLASGVAPVLRMLAAGLNVGLGTDGPAGSENDMDMMREMYLAPVLQKVSSRNPRSLPARQAVEMATLGGARVLGMGASIGSLEADKSADMITLRLDRPHAVPMYDVYSQIVYALQASDVEDVMVNGRTLIRDGASLTLQAGRIMDTAREYQKRIAASVEQR